MNIGLLAQIIGLYAQHYGQYALTFGPSAIITGEYACSLRDTAVIYDNGSGNLLCRKLIYGQAAKSLAGQ